MPIIITTTLLVEAEKKSTLSYLVHHSNLRSKKIYEKQTKTKAENTHATLWLGSHLISFKLIDFQLSTNFPPQF